MKNVVYSNYSGLNPELNTNKNICVTADILFTIPMVNFFFTWGTNTNIKVRKWWWWVGGWA